MDIDDKFLDVDFTTDSKYVAGALPEDGSKSLLCYEDHQPMIDDSKWPELCEKLSATKSGLEWLIVMILNQLREGSCVGNASTQGHMIRQAVQLGRDLVTKLSASSLYQLIGSSPNSGAMVSDALDEMNKVGIVPLDTPENRAKFGDSVMPATGFYTKRPSGAAEVAKKFRLNEWFVIRSMEGLVSAQLSGHPVIVGRAGHSICYVRPFYKDGRMYNLYVNSWGEWGQGAGYFDHGFGVDSMSYMRSSAQWAFALRSVTVPT
jgi:hypothetical protein